MSQEKGAELETYKTTATAKLTNHFTKNVA